MLAKQIITTHSNIALLLCSPCFISFSSTVLEQRLAPLHAPTKFMHLAVNSTCEILVEHNRLLRCWHVTDRAT